MRIFFLSMFIFFMSNNVYGSMVEIVDQSNIDNNLAALNNIVWGPTGQEFTPKLSSMDFVYFWIGDMDTHTDNAAIQVNVRQNDIYGTLLGTSEILLFEAGYFNSARFNFQSTVELIPGQRYVFELSLLTGDSWGVADILGDPYKDGRAIHGGTFQNTDYWFSEGIVRPIPIPSAVWLLAFGLIGLISLKKSKKRAL